MAPKSNVPIRICGSKTRSGCKTCKQRHVKCDEQRPVCFKCQKRNRECVYDYVQSQTPQKHSPSAIDSWSTGSLVLAHQNYVGVPISDSVSPYGRHEAVEVAAVRHFVADLGKDLAGRFSDEVWCNVFPRIAQHEPAIWHATVAVGMLDTSTRLDNEFLGCESRANAAIRHYSRAIQELNTRLSFIDSASCRDVVLLSCLLFAVFECLQNNLGQALRHISGGTKLLMEWTNDAMGGGQAVCGMYLDRRALLPMFLALDSQAVQMGVVGFRDFTSLPAIIDPSSTPQSFSSVDEAHVALSSIFNRMGRWAHWVEPCTAVGKRPTATWVAEERRTLQKNLAQWDRAFESMSQSCHDQPGSLLLRVHRTVIQIFFDKSIAGPSELAYDNSMLLFEKGIEYAESYLHLAAETEQQDCRPRKSGRVFTAAMDIVMSLFVLSAKCRDSKLRRRALSMLKTCNRKEGIWDSHRCALVAERMMELEERAALPNGFIPESARVFEIDVHLDDEDAAGEIVHKMHVRSENGNLHIKTFVDSFSIG